MNVRKPIKSKEIDFLNVLYKALKYQYGIFPNFIYFHNISTKVLLNVSN